MFDSWQQIKFWKSPVCIFVKEENGNKFLNKLSVLLKAESSDEMMFSQ